MALEDEVAQMTRRIKDLVSTLERTSSGALGQTSPGNQDVVRAIARLSVALTSGTNNLKQQQRQVEKFVKQVSSAESATRSQTQAIKTNTQGQRQQATAGENVRAAFKRMDAGIKAASDRLEELRSVRDLGRNITGLAASSAAGNANLQIFNGVVGSAARVLGDLASSVLPGFGGIIKGLATGTAEAYKFLIAQVSETATVFNALSRTGAVTGMTQLREQFLASGLTLQQFQSSVDQFSLSFARLSGTTAEGTRRFSELTASLIDTDLGRQLRRLGFFAEDIGKFSGLYIRQQTRLGIEQSKNSRDLRQGTLEYILQLDQLSKITGRNREQLAADADSALSQARFRASYDSLVAAGQVDAANAMQQFQLVVQQISPEMGQGLRDIASGFVSTDAAMRLFTTTGGAATDIMNRVKSGNLDYVEAVNQLQAAVRRQIPQSRELAKAAGDEHGRLVAFAEQSDFVNARLINGQLELEKSQQRQMQKGTDPLTDSTVAAQEQLQQLSRQLNNIAFAAMPAAAKAIEAFATVTNSAVKKIASAIGIEIPSIAGSTAAQPRGGPAFSEQRTPQDVTGSYIDRLAQLESGGRNIANVPRAGQKATSAFGLYQITKGTFQSLAANAGPGNPLRGKTFEDMQADVELQREAAMQLTSSNAQLLARRGLSTSDAAKYMAHMLGYGTAARVLEASEGARLETLVPKGWLAKNGLEKYATAGQLRQHFDRITGNQGYRMGGIARGPDTGYAATLHGTEAVVPLPDGRAIPVKIDTNLGDMIEQLARRWQQDLMTAMQGMTNANMESSLQQLVELQRSNNTTQQRMLQAAVN